MSNFLVGWFAGLSVWFLTAPHNYDEPVTLTHAMGCVLVGIVVVKFYSRIEAKK